jgi:hypothetical protein
VREDVIARKVKQPPKKIAMSLDGSTATSQLLAMIGVC